MKIESKSNENFHFTKNSFSHFNFRIEAKSENEHKKCQNDGNSPSNSKTHQIIDFFNQKRKINADQQIKTLNEHPKK